MSKFEQKAHFLVLSQPERKVKFKIHSCHNSRPIMWYLRCQLPTEKNRNGSRRRVAFRQCDMKAFSLVALPFVRSHSCNSWQLYSRACWQLQCKKRASLTYFSQIFLCWGTLFSLWDPDLWSPVLKPRCSNIQTAESWLPTSALSVSGMYTFICSLLCISVISRRPITVEQPPVQDDGLPFSLGHNLSKHIFTKAATWSQARECAERRRERPTVGQTEIYSCAPLTFCAAFSGWVMSHCSPMSLMQRATGRSRCPHSATFTSPVRIWSHTSHFTFSLRLPVINLLNQWLFNFPPSEIGNGGQSHWAAASSHADWDGLFLQTQARSGRKQVQIAGFVQHLQDVSIAIAALKMLFKPFTQGRFLLELFRSVHRWLRDHTRPVASLMPSAKLPSLHVEDYETGFKIESCSSRGL